MCSCAISPSRQYQLSSFVKTRPYIRDGETLSAPHFGISPPVFTTPASAPPSLGEHYVTSRSGSSWSARQHYDGLASVHVLLKKHETQFKLSQGRF